MPGLSHRVRSLAAALVMAGFLAHRWSQFPLYRSKLLWLLEVLIYVAMMANFVRRSEPRAPARGFRQALLPYVAAASPFAMFLVPLRSDLLASRWAYDLAEGLLLVGTALTVTSMACLGRSFGISVAVRVPVLHGPYRYVRHPVYLGEIISILGVLVMRWSLAAAVVAAIFVALQVVRARVEEEALGAASPDYAAWRARTGMFLPGL